CSIYSHTVDGKSHLENAFRTHSDQNTVIVLIDCGGNINVSEELVPLPDSQVFVIDSHAPYDLDNIYDGDVVKVVIPENFDLEVPRYEDIYEEDSDDEDGPNRKRRRDEEDEEENSLLPKKERWKRKREELLFTYYELSGYNLSVSLMIFELAWKMSKDNSQLPVF
ncbi:cell division control protein 45 homolog, partial [Bolinopsis microptera]|uniref:cell division control protein 45 homolog n=1 Tax=Bolinopsis microptera TaxID=2820187 RepID=UPI003079D064